MTQPKNQRGFVMILVLLLVVALTAAVIGQVAIVQNQKLTSLRDDDQVRARAVGEHCLARARMYVDQLRRDQVPADFDSVLDPGLNSHPAANGGAADFSDDFVPAASFGGGIAYIPADEVSSSGLRQAKHRFRFVTFDGGGCFVRFDDNSDDNRSGVGNDNAVPDIEGTGVDVPFRDRDIGIFLTAIGVYPVKSGATAAAAYADAHARISLRVLVNTGGAPGVVAHDDLVVQSDVAICGQGGFQGDNLGYSGGGSAVTVCACGDTATVSGAAQPNDCNYASGPGDPCDDAIACQPGATANLPAPPNPDVKVPTPVNWLQLDGMQDPLDPKPLGANGMCEFYFRSDNVQKTWSATDNNIANNVNNDFFDVMVSGSPVAARSTQEKGEMFLWDHTDNDAQACRTLTKLGTCAAADIVTHNCKTDVDTTYLVSGKKVVKRPCRWSGGDGVSAASNDNGPIVQCTDPGEQTPCWKLIARFTEDSVPGRAVVQQDHGSGDACSPACSTGVCDRGICVPLVDLKEDTVDVDTEVFSPNNGQRVPNIEAIWGDQSVNGNAPGATGSNNDGTAATITSNYWTNLCGPCPNCTNIAGWEIQGDEHFHFEKVPMCGDNFFNPAIMIFENMNDSLTADNETGRFHVKANWGTGCATTPRATVIVQATADIDQNTRICGAFSDCSTFPAACNRGSVDKANGLVLRAGGECYVGDGAVFIGDMQCGVIHVNNTNSTSAADCIIGDLVAFNKDAFHPKAKDKVGALGVCPDPGAFAGFVDGCAHGFCANNTFKMVGDIVSEGDICIKSGATIFGSVLGGGAGPNQGNIYIESNVTINGQLVSEGDIGIKTNTIINNNGSGTFGTRVNAGIVSEGSF